ncbi:MAG: hypothetical protein OXI56_04740 [bacterium]|nr:hypothetical protein [bacterium]MDE0601085.1 hypothetical protein [bacterium]
MAGELIPQFEAAIVEGISAVLGDTNTGLTGSQIGERLREVRVRDVDPKNTKWNRLYNALAHRQNQDQAGNCVVAFVIAAMKPVRFRNDPARFTYLQDGLNEVLIHAHGGLRVNNKGQVAKVKAGAAETLDEAAARTGSIRTVLRRRSIHPEVVRYCTDELLARNKFPCRT